MAESKLVSLLRASLPVLLTTAVGVTLGSFCPDCDYEVRTAIGGIAGCGVGALYSFDRIFKSLYE